MEADITNSEDSKAGQHGEMQGGPQELPAELDQLSNNALQNLARRGFIRQCSNFAGLDARMNSGPITFYLGIDPSGPSMHLGHIVPIFAAAHLAKSGHRAIILIGGGTALIGDPSGKSEMRKMISEEDIAKNSAKMQGQIEGFLGRAGVEAEFRNNSDWLRNLNYIDFLRDIGRHFSVNRMLGFEAYKQRMERGLSFIEFNYQLLQSFDSLELFRREGCQLQIGGDDQWGNIVAGTDLIRRKEGHEAESYALTFPLITRSDNKKMGKTEKDAIFLEPSLTSPLDFFQYLRNTPDDDVYRFLRLFTLLPLQTIDEMQAEGSSAQSDRAINKAKAVLAYELTCLVHGKNEADTIRSTLSTAFAGSSAGATDARTPADLAKMPGIDIEESELEQGVQLVEVFHRTGLCASKSEARRLIRQGGAQVGEKRIQSEDAVLRQEDFGEQGVLVLRAGKKRFARVSLMANKG